VPKALPGSITTAGCSGRSHGGPTHSPAALTGRWNRRHASSHPDATGSQARSSAGASPAYPVSVVTPSRSSCSSPSGNSASIRAIACSAWPVGTRRE